MASAEINLINLALARLGQDPIITITPPTPDEPSAQQAALHYAKERDSVLRAHWWNSATERAKLSQLSEAPLFGYTAQFQLPSDFIRLADFNEDGTLTFRLTRFRVEGRKVLTHDTSGNIIYVKRLEDVSQMDEGLKDAIIAKLAAAMCLVLTGDETRKTGLLRDYEAVLSEAQTADATESGQTVLQGSSWVNARFTGVSEVGFRKIDVG